MSRKVVTYAAYAYLIIMLISVSALYVLEVKKSESSIPYVEVYMSRDVNCTDVITHVIDMANTTVYAMIYSFTREPIANALIRAYERNVTVVVIFEPSQITEYSQYAKIASTGIVVHNSTVSGIMHHKVVVIDTRIIITGSYNWSKNAETENAENLVIIVDSSIAKKYEVEFMSLYRR